MQILLSLICDWYMLKILVHYVKNIEGWVCFCLLTNWYYFSMLNRNYINSVETCLFVVSFYYWLLRDEGKMNDFVSRAIVVISFSVRPTCLFLWAVIWPYELFTKKEGKIWFIVKNIIHIFVTCLFSFVVGSWWYGKWVWIDYNFFKVEFVVCSIIYFTRYQSCTESTLSMTILSSSCLLS